MVIPYRTTKLKTANIFAITSLGPITKFNPRQNFQLYGNTFYVGNKILSYNYRILWRNDTDHSPERRSLHVVDFVSPSPLNSSRTVQRERECILQHGSYNSGTSIAGVHNTLTIYRGFLCNSHARSHRHVETDAQVTLVYYIKLQTVMYAEWLISEKRDCSTQH